MQQLNITALDNQGFFQIKTAAAYPDPSLIDYLLEPWVRLEIITPEKYLGAVMDLVNKNRGIFKEMNYLTSQYINNTKYLILFYEIPAAEIITNFFDKLKSLTQGYASMDYSFLENRKAEIVKVSILINYETAEALSFLTHKSNAEFKGREMVEKLAKLIPKQQFPLPIQAAIGTKIFARETIAAYRKDVTAKLYGGDVSRKIKLLEKQKKGKKRLKMFGKVQIPHEVFLKALKLD